MFFLLVRGFLAHCGRWLKRKIAEHTALIAALDLAPMLLEVVHGAQLKVEIIAAAEAALETGGSVGPLELLQHMSLLHPVHVAGWRKGNVQYRALEPWIQVGPE